MVLEFKARVLKRHPDAAYQEIDGMAMVVVPGRAEVQILNPVGTRVWDLIDGERTVSQILSELAGEYEVEPGQLENDVREFVLSLDERDMLLPDEVK